MIELKVNGMHCTGCENRIKNALSTIDEVKKVSANHKNGQVTVTLKNPETKEIKEKIIEALETLDFEVEK